MRIVKTNNKEWALKIEKSLRENDGYCPCRVMKTEDTKCMCKEFREQTVSGYCHCGLYYKEVE